jgi:dipeptidyl aminopeptidase/acylaminoacyl peptidase
MSAMSDQVYSFDARGGGPLELLQDGSDRPLRWATWKPDGSACLLVGNRGSAVLYSEQGFSPVDTNAKDNLRGAAFSPDGSQALLVGNRGAVLVYDQNSFSKLRSPTTENLRRVAWHPGGDYALIVGNAGTVLRYEAGNLTPLPGDRAHTLRAIAWRPDGAYALVGAYASTWAGYPRPHALYKCDGAYLQALLTSDAEDDFVAVDWHPDGKRALIAGYAYDPSTPRNRRGASAVNKLVIYDGDGFTYQQVEASTSLLGAAWCPGPQGDNAEYALLCGEGGALLRYADAKVEQLDSGTTNNLVGPFWRPDGSRALFLRGPEKRVYTV